MVYCGHALRSLDSLLWYYMEHLIIIPVYNKPALTRRCLESIARTANLERHHVCVVDDASTLPTQRILQQFQSQHPNITLIRNRRNRGKPASLNQALRRFPKAKYFTVIDNDVWLQTINWPENLTRAHRDWNDRAILGAYTYMTGFPIKKNNRHYLDPWPFWNLAGCFFSFSQPIFKKLGYFFDKSRRSEDADYCRRAYLAGFRWFYTTDIKAKISAYKSLDEQIRLRDYETRERRIRIRWGNHVMKTHKLYYHA